MTRYAVTVRYVQTRTIMVDATTNKQAAQKAEEVARGFTNVVGAQAMEVRVTSSSTRREALGK